MEILLAIGAAVSYGVSDYRGGRASSACFRLMVPRAAPGTCASAPGRAGSTRNPDPRRMIMRRNRCRCDMLLGRVPTPEQPEGRNAY